jgi:hypothetical protein
MANVLSVEKREQVIALGRLGWSLRRIEGGPVPRRRHKTLVPARWRSIRAVKLGALEEGMVGRFALSI